MIRNALAVFPPSPLLPRKTSKLVKNKTRHWLNKREKGGEGKQTESVQSLQAVKIPPQLSPIPVAFRGHLCILILPPAAIDSNCLMPAQKNQKNCAYLAKFETKRKSLEKVEDRGEEAFKGLVPGGNNGGEQKNNEVLFRLCVHGQSLLML